MTEVHWLIYRNDVPARPGWHVERASDSLPAVERRRFISLAGSVPWEQADPEVPLFFGSLTPQGMWMALARNTGPDGTGRPGGWCCWAFWMSEPPEPRFPLAWTEQLVRQLSQQPPHQESPLRGGSNGPPEEAAPCSRVPAESSTTTALGELVLEELLQARRCVLFLNQSVSESMDQLDQFLHWKSQKEEVTYLLPVPRVHEKFSVVGLSLARIQEKEGLLGLPLEEPKPSAPPKPSRWFRLTFAVPLVALVLLAGYFYVQWNNTSRRLSAARYKLEQAQQSWEQIFQTRRQLARKISEQGLSLEQILRQNPRQIQNLEIKVGTTTYSFAPQMAQEISIELLQLWEQIDRQSDAD